MNHAHDHLIKLETSTLSFWDITHKDKVWTSQTLNCCVERLFLREKKSRAMFIRVDLAFIILIKGLELWGKGVSTLLYKVPH